MDLIKRFKELYHEMKESRDVANMKAYGEATKKMFYKLAEVHPEMAEEMLEWLMPIECHNYLSDEEAKHIVAGFISQDGSRGPHWEKVTFEGAVNRLGGKTEDAPHYNSNALWVVANMIYSDHAESIAEDMGYSTVGNAPAEKMAKSCYRKAVESLTDPDRPRFVRAYFDLD